MTVYPLVGAKLRTDDVRISTFSLTENFLGTPADRLLRWALVGLSLPGFLTLPQGGGSPLSVSRCLYAVFAAIALLAYLTPASISRPAEGRATWYLIGAGYPVVKTV